MNKKQILKIGRKKRIAVVMLLISIGAGAAFQGVLAAGNYTDTYYYFHVDAVGGPTEVREKWDDTSAYINHWGYVPVNVQVKSNGVNYTGNGGSYIVTSGPQKLINYVKENGRNDCYLYLTPTTGYSTWLEGLWSPDSI